MATGAVPDNSTSSPASQHALKSSAFGLFGALVWGAIMLFVFGFWMRSKYDSARPIVTNIFFLLGAVSAALAGWQAFTLWFKTESPQQKTASLEQQRRIFSYVFLVGGIGLIIMAFALGMGKKPGGTNYVFLTDTIAETFGILLFGIIALCTGYVLQLPRNEQISPIQFLLDKVPILKMSQIVIAALCLIGLGWFFVTKRAEFTIYFPELTALLFMSMLCLGCFLWLNTGGFDEFGVRLFVLIFGGSTGLILFVMTLARAYLWRQDILLGGTVAWQGENAWKFWVCAYLLFTALALMFISFNLARADIRKNAALRRVMYGYDALVQLLLLVGVLFILNIVIFALFPLTFEWTQNRGAYALSDASKKLISGLKKETNVIVLIPQNQLYYKDIKHLMENCQALNKNLKVQYLPPDADQKDYENLENLFPAVFPEGAPPGAVRGILLVYGAMPTSKTHTTPHAFVAAGKVFDFSGGRRPGDKPKYLFKGELEILKELSFLVDKQKKRTIYILQGNGEVDINGDTDMARRSLLTNNPAATTTGDLSQVGIGLWVERLTKDNYNVSGLSFNVEVPGEKSRNIKFAEIGADKKKDIPGDCDTLVIAGVAKPLHKDIVDAIDRYMDHGGPDKTPGKALVFLDVFVDTQAKNLTNTGLEELLKRYGVEVTNDFPLRVSLPLNERDDPRTLIATTPKTSENPLAKQFIDRLIIMKRTARIVRPAEASGQYKAEPILHLESIRTDRLTIIENKVRALTIDPNAFIIEEKILTNEANFKAKVKSEPVPVAVAVTEQVSSKPRMVVFGDTEFITNPELAYSRSRLTNYDFTASALEWMAEREFIGPRPRESNLYIVNDQLDDFKWRMLFLPGWLMFLVFVGLGIAIWVVRRR